jgi:predicted transcriptional regulator
MMVCVRTTLTLDDDVLARARQLAEATGESLGAVISDLARDSLTRRAAAEVRNGILLVPVRSAGTVVTLEDVNRLRDEGP